MKRGAENSALALLKNVFGVILSAFFYYMIEAISNKLPVIIALVALLLAATAVAYLLITIYRSRAALYAVFVTLLLLVIEVSLLYLLMHRLGVDSSKRADLFYALLKVPGYLPGLLLQVFLPLLMVLVLTRFIKKGLASTAHQESRA
jgi:hypothetical protein